MNAMATVHAARRWRPARRPAVVPLKWAWPAYLSAFDQLVYAAEKGYYATQGRLGVPGGPQVTASQYADTPSVALAQWTLASLGVLSAVMALAAVRRWGGLVPRPLLLLGLWGTAALAAVSQIHVVHEALFGSGSGSDSGPAGWSGRAAVQGVVGLCLWLAMAWLFTRRRGQSATAAAKTVRGTE
ncbi:hypothetical protein ACFXDJ_07350 [Streptomyces sp. NPDC059443]|uniref:hypothetical protein n=1 Tax=unclassified Streptomyces TaxID=2593676 RepID=UPI0036AA6360